MWKDCVMLCKQHARVSESWRNNIFIKFNPYQVFFMQSEEAEERKSRKSDLDKKMKY